MGRDLLRRKALALLPLTLLLLAQPPAGRADPGRPLRLQPGEAPAGLGEPTRHLRSAGPEYGLEIPDHPAIREWEGRYASARLPELSDALERGRLYRRYVAAKLRERGLPQELLFLPVLESHYRGRAVSRSGAVGLWQIMANTADPLGLRRNLWLDERRDFWLATEAALRKLEEDYRRFGSWPLALAAYNCGGGSLSRAIRAGASRDFWELRARGLLPRETAEYVPKFYALAKICSYPGRNGLTPPPAESEASPAWVRIELTRSVELALLSRACDLPEELLARANAELNFGITPPPAHRFALKVPADSEERVRSVLGNPEIELLRYQLHTVRSGDTFYGLARHYGAAVELIQSSNPGVDPRRMRIGMLLKIPVVGGAVREPPPAPSTPTPSYDGRYVVRSGDTLWAISRRHGITPELLAAANGRALDELLRPGDTLKVPATEASGTEGSPTEGSGTPGPREGSGT